MEPQDTLDPTLLLRYLEAPHQLTADEQAQMEQWLGRNPQHPEELDRIRQLWEQSAQARPLETLDTEADWATVWSRMQRPSATTRTLKTSTRIPFWRIAAAIALLLTTVWALWQFASPAFLNNQQAYVAQDTVMTVTLPDGSQVYLNEAAHLTYEDDFGEQTRTVRLEGEAYFEVAHNPATPFLIHTEQTTVRVVGTTFNVRADDQAVKVTVRSGTVAFSHQEDTVLLTQNEVGEYQDEGLRVFENNNPNYLAWKTGLLIFDDTPFRQVVQDLSGYYRIPMRIANGTLDDLTFTSTLNRQPLKEVLEELQMTLNIDYTYQANQVTFR